MEEEYKKRVAEQIADNVLLYTKEVLTTDEAAKYMGIKKSYLYKLTMAKQIPHYKPTGKMCYFNRLELENWLQNNRISTDQELEDKAQFFCMKKERGQI